MSTESINADRANGQAEPLATSGLGCARAVHGLRLPRRGERSRRGFEQLPLAGHPSQAARTEGAEHEVGVGGEIPYGPSHQHLKVAGLVEHASRDVHADASDLLVEDLDLSRVDGGADTEPRIGEPLEEIEGAPDR